MSNTEYSKDEYFELIKEHFIKSIKDLKNPYPEELPGINPVPTPKDPSPAPKPTPEDPAPVPEPAPTPKDPAPVPAPVPAPAVVPLSLFRLQLPTGENGVMNSVEPIGDYEDQHFYKDDTLGAYVFNTEVWPSKNPATSPGSNNTRTELREIKTWKPKGEHSMKLEMSVNKLPKNMQSTIISQIYAENVRAQVLIVFQQNKYNNLYEVRLYHVGSKSQRLGYAKLGEKFKLSMEIKDSKTKIRFNDVLLEGEFDPELDHYFKAGSFVISTKYTDAGDETATVCVYSLDIKHSIPKEPKPEPVPEPNVALSLFRLQLPTGKNGAMNSVYPIGNYKDKHFYKDMSVGAYVFNTEVWPSENPATSPNSKNTRTELREVKTWNSKGEHSMHLTMSVNKLPKVGKSTIISQIFAPSGGSQVIVKIGFKSTLNKYELRLYNKGSKSKSLGFLNLGEKFKLWLDIKNTELSVKFNDKETIGVVSSDNNCYFKAGSYCGSTKDIDEGSETATVYIYELEVKH